MDGRVVCKGGERGKGKGWGKRKGKGKRGRGSAGRKQGLVKRAAQWNINWCQRGLAV